MSISFQCTRKRATGDVLLSVLLLFFVISTAQAGQPSYAFPAVIDKNANYLFFFHNYYVELNGPDGDCRYYELLRSFVDRGFVVVSQLRSPEIPPVKFANKAAEQIQAIINTGVPPANMTVSGHSKGGVIALNVAALLQQADINYIILAGCGIKPLAKAYPDPLLVKGTFLSLYANSDKIAGSCSYQLSPTRQGVSIKELALDSPEGHRLFFQPNNIWLKHFSPTLTN